MEWEAGLYLSEGKVVLPSENLHKCFIEGARATRDGKKFEAGVRVPGLFIPLDYEGEKIECSGINFPNKELDKYYDKYKDIQMVTVGASKIPRCRPVFKNWSCVVVINYNEDIINEATVVESVRSAGVMKGLGDRRPLYGTFDVEEIK